MNSLEIGSIINDTMRNQDIIPELLPLVQEFCPTEYAQLTTGPWGVIPSHALEDDDADWWDSSAGCELREVLVDLLQDFVPPYCYIGSHPGNGSDLGVWPDWDAVEMSVHDGDLVKVDAGSEFPEDTSQVLVVNDHGNASLYVRGEDGQWREVWSIA